MKNFKYAAAKTLEQAVSFISKEKGKFFLLAGGTDLLGEIKEGIVEPDVVVDLKSIPGLSYIKKERDGFMIGAMTTLAELAQDSLVEKDYPGLHQAVKVVASPQIRNVGTIGGNLCQQPRCWYYRDPQILCNKKGGSQCFALQGRNKYHAIFGGGICSMVHPSDLAPALISLGAKVTLATPNGEKTLPLDEFFIPPLVNVRKENVLSGQEILKEIRIPLTKKGERSTYLKFTERGTWDFALVSAAVEGTVSGSSFSDIKIICGGVAPLPWRLKKVEDALRGKRASEAFVRQAVRTALQEASPLEENAYKVEILEAVLVRAIRSLLST